MLQKEKSRAQEKFREKFWKFLYPQDQENKWASVKESDHEYYTVAEACSKVSDAEKCRIEIRPAIPFVPDSAVESDRTKKKWMTSLL